MALFGSKKNTVVKAKTAKVVKAEKVAKVRGERTADKAPSYAAVLLRPRITEKAAMVAETQNVYTFEVAKTATKKSVAQAVSEYYKVTPVRINMTNLPRRRVLARGKVGMKSGVKKALVFLKKGDKIEFV